MTFVVGLTGGIGSGKSTVADLFAQRGAALVDTDLIAHALTAPRGGAMGEIVETFGEQVLAPDGSLNRTLMRQLVFADPLAKVRLEGILHPLIRRQSEQLCLQATGAPYVLLIVPLLLEAGGYRQRVDRILVVDCDEAQQVARVVARSGISADDVRAIMATQLSRRERCAAADDLVANQGTREDLASRVDGLHELYLTLAQAKVNKGC